MFIYKAFNTFWHINPQTFGNKNTFLKYGSSEYRSAKCCNWPVSIYNQHLMSPGDCRFLGKHTSWELAP